MTSPPIFQAIVVSRPSADGVGVVAGVHQQEAAGAVGVLGHARREAGLAEERRLLIAGDAGDGDRRRRTATARSRRRPRTTRAPSAASRRGTPRMRSSSSSQSSVWMSNSSVRLALVTSVTCVLPPVRRQIRNVSMVPNRMSPRSARARRPGTVSSRCVDLGAREVGVEDQPGLAADQRLVAVGLQAIADRRADAALPDDGVAPPACPVCAIPEHGRLALVGDADGGDVGGGDAGAARAPRARSRAATSRWPRDRARPRRAWGRSAGTRVGRRDTTRPSRPKSIARLDVVPWSSAST